MKIYLDNAATTSLDKEVLDEMLPYMTEHFGGTDHPFILMEEKPEQQ